MSDAASRESGADSGRTCQVELAVLAAMALAAAALRLVGGWAPGLALAVLCGTASVALLLLWPVTHRENAPTWSAHAMTGIAAAVSVAGAWATGSWVLLTFLPFHNVVMLFWERPAVSWIAGGAGLTASAAGLALVRPDAISTATVLVWSVATAVLSAHAAARLQSHSSRVVVHLREKLALSEAMGRFTTDYLTRQVLREGVAAEGGERREVSVLFTDLRGFTTLAEKMPPDAVVTLLNGYFSAMVKAVRDHRGHVNKFIGDAVMAVFGAPEHNPWHAADAVKTALAMREALAKLNVERRSRREPEIRMGIGIHSGEVVAGVVGGGDRLEWTVVGDTVNVASRVEALNKEMGTDLLITESVQKRIDPSLGFRRLSSVKLRGKSRAVAVYALRETSSRRRAA